MPSRHAIYCVGAALLAVAPALPAEEAASRPRPFAKAIAYAQERSVKIYGAGVGLEHGFAAGVIVAADGQILTAEGIILSTQNLRVVTPDGRTHQAQVLRRSTALQAALLKIDAATPRYFTLPAQSPVQRGDWVLALNNAFKVAEGTEPLSVNAGIVSAVNPIDAKRKTQVVPYEGPALIIDAITSNPGAPGGALVMADGQLAGMIGRVLEDAATNTRLNYAVPAERLAGFVGGADSTTRPAPANAGKAVTGITLFVLGGRKAPAYVDRIAPRSPAQAAGMKKDDLILAVNGKVVRDIEDYQALEAALPATGKISFTIKRKDKILVLTLTLEAPDAQQP